METSLAPSLIAPITAVAEAAPSPYVLPEIGPPSPRPVRIIENLNPLRPEQRRAVDLTPLDNESVEAIVIRAGLDVANYKHSLNGELLQDGELACTAIRPGDEIVLYPLAAGGKIWQMVAMLALAVVVGSIVPGSAGLGLFGSFLGNLTTAQASMIAAGVSLGGSLLISWAFNHGQPQTPAWSTTYDPTGPKGLAQPGVPVPKAYGIFGWCGNVISSYVTFAGQDAYINLLVCYGWGFAQSITNVLINQQSISVFLNTTYQVRYGTNDQAPIDGFDRTVNGYPVEEDLLVANGPIIIRGTGTDIEGLDITVKFPSGLYRVTNDGNDVPLKFIYKVEVSPYLADAWVMPLFPNATTTAASFTGMVETWPAWCVLPTDRYAGTGIVYATDNGSHTPGDAWSNTETVTITNLDLTTTTTSQTFQGEWQPLDPNTNPVLVTSWWQGYRVVQNNTFSAFFDTTSVYGLTAGRWDVRLTKIGYCPDNNDDIVYFDATDSQHICDGWFWNINEITLSNLSYPNMVLIGIKALATSQLNGGSIQIQATIEHGVGVDTVMPSGLSGYEFNNPAVVCYDLLTNPIYGMGIAANQIDVPAFEAWAAFNDETVTDQDGTTTRRHIFAGVFDQAGDAWRAMSIIGAVSRATVLQIGMRYTVVLDAPADPVQLFTVGNTKKDSFQEQWVSLDDRCTLIECEFADAARNYRMDIPVSVMTASDLNSGTQPKITRTRLTGCTSRDQAWRWAYFHLMSTKLTLRTIQISAPIEAVCCQIGSVIALQSDVVQWAVGGRVQPGSTSNTVNVDRTDLTFATAAGWTVSVQHPSVLRGTATISSIVGTIITMTAALPTGRIVKLVGVDGTEYIVTGYAASAVTLATVTGPAAATPLAATQVVSLYDTNVIDNLSATSVVVTPASSGGPGGSVIAVSGTFSTTPQANSAWAYGQSAGAQPAKLFRVVGIKRSGDFSFDITAMEYNAEIYEDVVPNYGEVVGVPNSSPAILNLSLTEQYQNGTLTGSSNSALIAVGWQNGNTAVGGQVTVQAQGGTANIIGSIQGQGCTFVGVIGTTYTVAVRGFDWQGNLVGAAVSASITVVASTNAPGNVASFYGVVGGSSTVLTWNAVGGADHYEIRWAPTLATAWADAEVLWDGTGVTWTDTTLRSGVYMIVAVSSLVTGSVQSVVPSVWSVPTAGGGSAPPTASMTIVAPTFSGTTGTINAPTGTVLNQLSGSIVTLVAGNLTVSWTPAANTTYYAYCYITTGGAMAFDSSFSSVSATPNMLAANAVKTDGIAAFVVTWGFGPSATLVGEGITQIM